MIALRFIPAPPPFVTSAAQSALDAADAWLADLAAEGWQPEPGGIVAKAIGNRGQPPNTVTVSGSEQSNVLMVRRITQPQEAEATPTAPPTAKRPPPPPKAKKDNKSVSS